MRDPNQDRAERRAAAGSGLEQRVLRRTKCLGLAAGSRVVVGFSGGPDSLTLLAVLSSIRRLTEIEPVAVHVDHGLRPESVAESTVAARLAAAVGARFRGVRIEAAALAQHHGVGVEEAARRERYHLLAQVARDEKARVVALAHHQSDQAETVLLHLLRGAGLGGASAMSEASRRVVPWWVGTADEVQRIEVVVWRPFLEEPKAVIADYAEHLGLEPVDDPSNVDCQFRRNAIRQRVLPLLEEVQPGATAALARYATTVAADDALLTDLAASILGTDAGELLARETVIGQPVAIQRRLLRAWLTAEVSDIEIGVERIEAVRALVSSGIGGKVVEIGGGYGVLLRDRFLRVIPVSSGDDRAAASGR